MTERDPRDAEPEHALPASHPDVPAARPLGSGSSSARHTEVRHTDVSPQPATPTPAGGVPASATPPRSARVRVSESAPALDTAPRNPDDAGPLPATAADLVATLWRDACTALRVADARPFADATDLRGTLERMSTDAELLAIRAPDAERPAARLLAETARAAYTVLDAPSSSPSTAVREDGMLASSVRRRLARMEHWLSARSATDANAEPAANLCLWVLERLEGDAT